MTGAGAKGAQQDLPRPTVGPSTIAEHLAVRLWASPSTLYRLKSVAELSFFLEPTPLIA